MTSFGEFESAFLSALQQERSDLQSLQNATEAQLSAWIQHLFQHYLGYTHWKEIVREGGTPIGAKGSKQLFPDLRIDILDSGVIFVECKRMGRLDGPKGVEELNDGVSQLRSYIRAHVDQASVKPKTVLGVVTDGNRWFLMGLNRMNEFHTIAEWTFLTDDPRLIAQRLWLLAKPALAQPTSALVEFLARRTLVEVLKENTRQLTRKVNDKLPDGAVSEEMIGKWLREAFSEPPVHARSISSDAPTMGAGEKTPQQMVGAERFGSSLSDIAFASPKQSSAAGTVAPALNQADNSGDASEVVSRRIGVHDLLATGLLLPQDVFVVDGADGRMQTATLTPEGKINVAGQLFDSVSPAALKALELAGKPLKSVNGWAYFRVLRGGNNIGTLLEIRGQYEDSEKGAPVPDRPQGSGEQTEDEGPDPAVLAALEQLQPLLQQFPELVTHATKSSASLYVGKLLIGYAFPRKRGGVRLRVYTGDVCPEWTTPDPTYAAWCFVEDWAAARDQTIALLNDAPRRRAEDMAAGHDAYRRRRVSGNALSLTPER